MGTRFLVDLVRSVARGLLRTESTRNWVPML